MPVNVGGGRGPSEERAPLVSRRVPMAARQFNTVVIATGTSSAASTQPLAQPPARPQFPEVAKPSHHKLSSRT